MEALNIVSLSHSVLITCAETQCGFICHRLSSYRAIHIRTHVHAHGQNIPGLTKNAYLTISINEKNCILQFPTVS